MTIQRIRVVSKVDDTKPHLRRLIDGRMYEVSGEMIVGRLAECNIVLDHEGGISRRHARFAVNNTNLFITDLGSLNGTLLNGELIDSESRLFSGDILIFDKDEYEVLIPWENYKSLPDLNETVFISPEGIDEDIESEQFHPVSTSEAAIDPEAASSVDAVSDAKVASDTKAASDAKAARC